MNKIDQLEQKSSVFWECIDYKKNPEGGYIYVFTEGPRMVRPSQLYPALEPTWSLLHQQRYDIIEGMDEKLITVQKSSFDVFQKLGYNWKRKGSKTILEVPDIEALTNNWKELKKDHPSYLPNLSIISSEGIASDSEYIEQYLKEYDFLISSGREFIHDFFYHALPTLTAMINDDCSYRRRRDESREIISKIYSVYRRVKQLLEDKKIDISEDILGKMLLVVSYITDNVAASSLDVVDEEHYLGIGRNLWDNPSSLEKCFIERNFGTESIHDEPFDVVWRRFQQIAETFSGR